MRLDDEPESSNVEDMRGASGAAPGGFPIGGRSLGLGGVLVVLVVSYFLGVNPADLFSLLSSPGTAPSVATAPAQRALPEGDAEAHFVARVLHATEVTWGQTFAAAGKTYEPPKLDLYTGSIPTACGLGQSAAGPFYCPADRKVYLDLDFFRVMRERFHASAPFAQAYVIAHEVGHHVQNLLGVSERMEEMRGRVSSERYNALSVRLELQADCLAGVWAARTDAREHFLDPGDVEAALSTAAAIGDDTLQRAAQGRVVPDSFTHGTSEQRVRWLRRGLEHGNVNDCNTFETDPL